jgi:hypothetical protein
MHFNYFRVNAMPKEPVASSIYAVKGVNATEANLYLVGTNPTDVRHLITAQEVDSKIADANKANAEMITAADIAERDKMELTQNQLVLVLDASADATVAKGKAVYFFTFADKTWTKIYEFEGMDVVLQWADIQNKPKSKIEDIDLAAERAVAHKETVEAIDVLTATLTGNQKILAGISEDADGFLSYNKVSLTTKNFMGDSSDPSAVDAYTPDW